MLNENMIAQFVGVTSDQDSFASSSIIAKQNVQLLASKEMEHSQFGKTK